MRLTSWRNDPFRWQRFASGALVVGFAVSVVVGMPANPSLYVVVHAITLIILLTGLHFYLPWKASRRSAD